MYHLAGPLLCQANEKWNIGIAFGAAALVHLAAILAGAIHHHPPDEEMLALPAGLVEVAIEATSPINESMPPPDVNPPVPSFIDEPLIPSERTSPPPARQHTSSPIVKGRKATPGSPSGPLSGRALTLSAPWPEYPPEAKQRNITGNGVVVMTIDPVSGSVTHVSMWKSTGSSCLDDAALRGFRRWRFKPGSVSKVKSPVTFTLTAAFD